MGNLTNLDYLYALADHYIKGKEMMKAQTVVERMIVEHPDQPLGLRLMKFIQQSKP